MQKIIHSYLSGMVNY